MYLNIFFDLDHTLWDFERNSQQTLLEIYQKYELSAKAIISFEDFLHAFRNTTRFLWNEHHLGRVDKEKIRQMRFPLIFKELKKDLLHSFLMELESYYHYHCPRQPNLLPHALDTLTYLKQKGYQLHILTNGFESSQKLKLEYSGILNLFTHVITSECTGFTKPNRIIFDHALAVSNATVQNSIMIGDSLDADILGARALGMSTIFYNPKRQPPIHSVATHDIYCLSELQCIL